MASRIVIDGNAFYEIDEDCVRRRRERERRKRRERERQEHIARKAQRGRGM